MTHAQHTPLPWVFQDECIRANLHTDDGNAIANPFWNACLPRDEAEANARFIVTACNAHYDLLAALRLAMRYISGKSPHVGARRELQEAVDAAIAKAEGK